MHHNINPDALLEAKTNDIMHLLGLFVHGNKCTHQIYFGCTGAWLLLFWVQRHLVALNVGAIFCASAEAVVTCTMQQFPRNVTPVQLFAFAARGGNFRVINQEKPRPAY